MEMVGHVRIKNKPMRSFIRNNWFKVAILIILIVGIFIFFKNFKQPKEMAIETPLANEALSLNVQNQTEQKAEPKKTTPSKIINQIKAFDDYLEYDLVGAQVDCIVLSTYNNLVVNGQANSQTFQQGFPESKKSYENKCRSSYVSVIMNEKILIAEPELQSLRMLLTSYTEEAKAFAQYALNGGYQSSRIDSAEDRMDNFRTLSREEVIRLKGKYNL